MRFRTSNLYVSAIPPFVIGAIVGILAAIMGVGGGFIMVPAMIYLIGMPTKVVVGTSVFQFLFVTGFTAVLHAVQSGTVDVLLALILLVGGVIGAQIGVALAARLRAEQLRILLALLVVGVCLKLFGRSGASSRAELFSLAGLLMRCCVARVAPSRPRRRPVQSAAQETVVTGVSTDNISLTANFDGSELFVFGAVRRDAPSPTEMRAARHRHHRQGPAADGDGPAQGPAVRDLGQRRIACRVRQAPSFYAVATTRPLDDDPRARPTGCATASAWTRRCAGSAATTASRTRALHRAR